MKWLEVRTDCIITQYSSIMYKLIKYLLCNIGLHKNEQRQGWDTDMLCTSTYFVDILMYIACLCPN